ncbi:TasA family protein [Rathayibacter sp. VKM Ac-2754]|uniref:TasA family protein n=1 Tax=Rathayibacter sp. VKM Ac-2754 TaxID=2609251 RepID=UPI00135C074A|nr:TasA family protein [Rathayibacter sp. VKM Ac-2754]MWV58888.1 peptidase [Rathayibacter sp. VKM Ac-2754]
MSRGAHRAGGSHRREVVGRLRGGTPFALATAGLLLLGAAGGAVAVFTDRASAGAGVSGGVVIAEFDATGRTTASVPVTGLTPGAIAVRLLDLTNIGTLRMSALQLETTAPVVGASSSDGLQLAIDRCSQPWSTDGATCAGTVTTVAADRPATARIDLPASPALAVGATDNLRLTVRLPESAPTGAQGTTGSLSITVTGVQRPGQHR